MCIFMHFQTEKIRKEMEEKKKKKPQGWFGWMWGGGGGEEQPQSTEDYCEQKYPRSLELKKLDIHLA